MGTTAALSSAAPPAPEAALFGALFLGFGACFGLAVGLFALAVFWGANQWRSLRKLLATARPTAIGDLASASGPVLVRGVVREVYDPVRFEGAPCAAVRLQVDGPKWDPSAERTTRGGIEGGRTARPFLLADATGVVRVDPSPLDPRLMGPGEPASLDQAREAALLLDLRGEGLPRLEAGSATARLWRWPVGTALTVLGRVDLSDGHPLLVKPLPTGLPASPLELEDLARQAAATGRTAQVIFWIVAAIGAGVVGTCLLAALSFFLRAAR